MASVHDLPGRVFNILDKLAQLREHALDGALQLSDFIVMRDINVDGEISGGEFFGHADSEENRTENRARQQPEQDQRKQRTTRANGDHAPQIGNRFAFLRVGGGSDFFERHEDFDRPRRLRQADMNRGKDFQILVEFFNNRFAALRFVRNFPHILVRVVFAKFADRLSYQFRPAARRRYRSIMADYQHLRRAAIQRRHAIRQLLQGIEVEINRDRAEKFIVCDHRHGERRHQGILPLHGIVIWV